MQVSFSKAEVEGAPIMITIQVDPDSVVVRPMVDEDRVKYKGDWEASEFFEAPKLTKRGRKK